MAHLTEDDVLVWLLTEDGLPADLFAHTRECDQCLDMLREGERFRDTLRNPASWVESPAPLREDILDQLVALERRLAAERDEAETALVSLTHAELERRIDSGWSTVGLVRALVDRSYAEVEHEPQQGEIFASLAVRAAHHLSRDEYAPPLVSATMGQAWRQQANALRMRGKLTETLEALDHASAAFAETTVPDPEIATIHYIRAAVFYTQGRLKEARTLLEDASRTFRRFGDDERYRNARMLLAGVMEVDGDRGGAIDLLRDLLKTVPSDDTLFRGRLLHNLGVFLLHDDQPGAESYLQQAHHCLLSAGLRTEALRALRNLGRAASRSGDTGRAASILRRAYEEAVALGIQLDVAMIALDRAELYLARGEMSRVATLCSDALHTFQAANAPRFAAEAFSHLQAVAKQQQLSAADIAFVRDFFTAAHADPQQQFIPPNN
jgi:tetratricopeptide (TPR) repeat protein